MWQTCIMTWIMSHKSGVWHEIRCVTWTQMCNMNQKHIYRGVCVWYGLVTRKNEYVALINASCHVHEWVVSHECMSHVKSQMHKLSHVKLQTRKFDTSDVTHMNMLCHTYECVVSHICMSHVRWLTRSVCGMMCVHVFIWDHTQDLA